MRRASASPAAWARASSPVRSRVALVATTASVVLRAATAPNGAPPRAKCSSASTNLPPAPRAPARIRSEEHTSELQSLAYLVCRLLLEKKKKNDRRHQELA